MLAKASAVSFHFARAGRKGKVFLAPFDVGQLPEGCPRPALNASATSAEMALAAPIGAAARELSFTEWLWPDRGEQRRGRARAQRTAASDAQEDGVNWGGVDDEGARQADGSSDWAAGAREELYGSGGQDYYGNDEAPDYFDNSFLDFEDEAQEQRTGGASAGPLVKDNVLAAPSPRLRALLGLPASRFRAFVAASFPALGQERGRRGERGGAYGLRATVTQPTGTTALFVLPGCAAEREDVCVFGLTETKRSTVLLHIPSNDEVACALAHPSHCPNCSEIGTRGADTPVCWSLLAILSWLHQRYSGVLPQEEGEATGRATGAGEAAGAEEAARAEEAVGDAEGRTAAERGGRRSRGGQCDRRRLVVGASQDVFYFPAAAVSGPRSLLLTTPPSRAIVYPYPEEPRLPLRAVVPGFHEDLALIVTNNYGDVSLRVHAVRATDGGTKVYCEEHNSWVGAEAVNTARARNEGGAEDDIAGLTEGCVCALEAMLGGHVRLPEAPDDNAGAGTARVCYRRRHLEESMPVGARPLQAAFAAALDDFSVSP